MNFVIVLIHTDNRHFSAWGKQCSRNGTGIVRSFWLQWNFPELFTKLICAVSFEFATVLQSILNIILNFTFLCVDLEMDHLEDATRS